MDKNKEFAISGRMISLDKYREILPPDEVWNGKKGWTLNDVLSMCPDAAAIVVYIGSIPVYGRIIPDARVRDTYTRYHNSDYRDDDNRLLPQYAELPTEAEMVGSLVAECFARVLKHN